MSAWLSAFLTVPHYSIYAHDLLSMPGMEDMIAVMEELPHPYKGIVDTGAGPDNIPQDAAVTVIDNDLDTVREKCRKWLGDDTDKAVAWLHERMEALKDGATVYHLSNMDEWIADFFRDHTGVPMDWARYRIMLNINIQSRMAHALGN